MSISKNASINDRDSAAKKRQKELAGDLGLAVYARYPVELLEALMDRPPADPVKRSEWRPVYGAKSRVLATYIRYSWCWPICMEYAVVADQRDEILHDHKGRPLVLTQERVAEMLGLSQQRVSDIVVDLVAEKRIRQESRPGGEGSRTQAVFLVAKPAFTAEERRLRSTRVKDIDGPRLTPEVIRRFENLLTELGDDDDRLIDYGEGPVRLADYRTRVWRAVLDNRTAFLETLKRARYSERKGYSDLVTQVRNLIEQSQSPEGGQRAYSAAASAPPSPDPSHAQNRPDEGRQAPPLNQEYVALESRLADLCDAVNHMKRAYPNTDFGQGMLSLAHAGDWKFLTDLDQLLAGEPILAFENFVAAKFKGLDVNSLAKLPPRSPGTPNGPRGIGMLKDWAKDFVRERRRGLR